MSGYQVVCDICGKREPWPGGSAPIPKGWTRVGVPTLGAFTETDAICSTACLLAWNTRQTLLTRLYSWPN